jgi:hypothetical protein
MNKIQIITMGASDDKLVSIRGTTGEVAMRFFADRLLGASADGFMAELHDTGETLRVFDGWGEMCMIEAKTDGPVAVQESHYTITNDDFVDALNQDEIKLPQAESP